MYNIDKKEIIRTFKLFYTGGSSMKKIRNILSLALVFIMLIGLMPMNVFAEPGDKPAPAVTVKSIAIDTSSTYKKEYKVGEELDVTGLKIIVTKSDDSTQTVDVTSGMVTGFNSSTAADSQKLTITYENQTITYNVSIKAKEPEVKKFKLTAKVDGEGGTVDPSGEKEFKENDNVTIKIKATGGYELSEVKVNDVEKKTDVANDELKLTMTENKKVVVKFKKKETTTPADPGTTPDPATKTYGISVYTAYNGKVKISADKSEAGKTITVTADPDYGYTVSSIVVRDGQGKKLTLFNEIYKNYYDDYPYYLRSRWYRGYDYDDYIRWCNKYDCSRYDYSSFKRWCNWNGYSYDYDDFKRFCDWDDIYDYGWYNRYGYSYLNQADFVMPNSAVTVEVTFTSAPYWYDGYYYDYETGTYRYYYDDDYYYYRNRKNKKSNYYERQAEKDKKEEEEAKAKAEAEKLPQVYENKAVIAIGSNVLDKVSKNVHTVHQMDTPAYVKNGRVMLPLRYVAEALGLQVSWVPETKTVIIWDLTQRVEIPVKSNRIIVNGITYTSDVKPEIKSSRTMLPIANIARALGLIDGSDIIWDQYNKQVTLTRKVLSK